MGVSLRWKALLGVVALSAVMVFGVTGAWAFQFHGIAFNKGCDSPTQIGQPYGCSYQILNVVDGGQDTLSVDGLSDQVHSAGGDVNSGNILPALQLIFSGAVVCTGGSGAGTVASPYVGATSCLMPFNSTITTNAHSFYTVQPGDFALSGHQLTDTASLNWHNTCTAPGVTNCSTTAQTATAGSSSVIQQLPTTTETTIHNAAHQPVTVVAAGTTVHDFVLVHGVGGNPPPSGNVNIDWFLNGTCAGSPAVNSGSIGPLAPAGGSDASFDATGFAFTVNTAGFRAFKAHYEGDATYIGSTGPCEPLQVVDANIQLTPPTATNRIGTNHVLTCHINVDDGSGAGPVNAPAGTVCTVSIISGPGSPASQNCTTVGATGDCQVTISSNTTGQSTIRASTDVAVAGVTLHRETGDGHPGDSPDAQKLWVNAAIMIAPSATNEVGHPHTFTATLLFDTGGGLQPAGAGQTVTVTLTNGNGAVANPAGPFTLTTNAAGQVQVTFTSATPGTVTGNASWTGSVSGSAPFTVTTDGVAPNSGPAVKTFVDANIQLTPPTATNRVGSNHVLTCHINVDDGSGAGPVNAPAGTVCTGSITNGPGSFVGSNQCTTVGNTGDCQLTITSSTTGQTTIHASTAVSVGGVVLNRATGDTHAGDSPDATKNWVNAAIMIAPSATNAVGQPHTFTATLLFDTGGGLQPAGAGQTVTVTLTNGNGAVANPAGPFTLTTNAAGQVQVTFTSQTPGTVTGNASWTGSVAGSAPFTVMTNGIAPNSGPAVKTFVDAGITLTPGTATNPVGTNHTLHCHIVVDDGSGAGPQPAPAGTNCTVNILSGPGTPVSQNCATVGATGTCDVIITSAAPGTSTLQATTTLSVGGVVLTRTTGDTHVLDGPNATKLWADDTVATHVRDAANNDITNQTVAGGTVVHDEATVSKAAGTPAAVPNPTGTVSFTLFDNGICNGNVVATDPNKPLDASGTATSATFTTPANGNFSYLAHYNGDANYPQHDGPCEPFSVASQTGKHLMFSGSMEGALKWMAGAWVNGGFHFHLSTKNPVPVTVQVTGFIDVPVHCGGPNGPLAAGSPIMVPVSIAPFTIPANNTSWWLSGDQNSILVWMGAVQSPDLCGGGVMYNSEGATFDVIVNSSAHVGVIDFQWHYRIPAAKGKPNTDCTNASDPNRNRADVCGASWSATKEP